MKFKSMILLAVALGCGLVAMLGVQQVLSGGDGEDTGVAMVLIATTDIRPGTDLNDTNTHFVEWPGGVAPDGLVTTPEEIEERTLKTSAVVGEPIMLVKLNEKGVWGASVEIPKGMRVITLPVNQTKTHSGLLMPGDLVDVIVSFKANIEGQKNTLVTRTILERVTVFAADSIRQNAVNGNNVAEHNAKNISLLVDPDQYNLCFHAQQKGTISLALRNQSDMEVIEATNYTDIDFFKALVGVGTNGEEEADDKDEDELNNILAEQDQPVVEDVVEPEKPKWTVRIYSGPSVEEEEFELPDPPVRETTSALQSPTAKSAGKTKLKYGWIRNFFAGA